MPPETLSSDQRQLLDDICPLHQTPMVRTPNHVGDGKVEYSSPTCPLCEDLKQRGVFNEAHFNEAKTKAEQDAAEFARKAKAASEPKAEQRQPVGVKPPGDAPAAKT